jgi:DNA-binding NarL/FixJ family response regulator
MALLHNGSGQDATSLASLYAMAKVLLMAVQAETSQARQALQDGAVDYVLKRISTDKLCRAIRTIAIGDIYLDPTIAGHLVAGYLHPPTPLARIPTTSLSPRARGTTLAGVGT